MTAANHPQAVSRASAQIWGLCAADAALLAAAGLIHLNLWDTAYRHVKTLGPLFLVQVIAAIVIAIAVLATRHVLAVAAAGLLMAGTIVGFIVVRTHGLFGFRLGFTSGEAWAVLFTEIAGVLLSAFTCWLMTRPQRT
jgi:hypothetical protein